LRLFGERDAGRLLAERFVEQAQLDPPSVL
jgi:hypothetical protein